MNPALKWMPLVVSIALVATGCAREGYYHDRNIDYTEAERSTPLVLPESRNTARYGDAMPIPDANREFVSSGGRFSAPRPDDVTRTRQRDYVQRRDTGTGSWLVVNAAPATVWTQLEDFARRQGLQVTERDPNRGVIETSQGRLYVRPGVQTGASEVRCEQAGQVNETCLSSLGNFLSGQSQTASASALARQQAVAEPDRVRLEQRGDDWVLVMDVDVEQAWNEIGYQLESHFTQENRELLLERDATQRDFLVEYMTESERDRGVISIIFSPDVRQTSQQLRLSLEAAGDGQTVVRVENESERAFTAEDEQEFLGRVEDLLR
ncbi:outer membrane protein assembly factor BamC [Litchfieldella xinjiangensis]|uniref:outer membrane protein assembly factor BamC n=1 Tax=Litchfieldella xinjiangensis TaxID=1166948 RepID=UPI0005B87D38|nr:outer membrane protein assembly factor BamC [Halomonas xinjiangensis]